ncbi:MAG: hypothetical protein ACI4JB_10780 [Porcipelethomonas sp.]
MTKKLKRPVAFLSAFVMVMAMLLYFPSGFFSNIDWGLKASAAGVSSESDLPSSGYVELTGDITLTEAWQISGNLSLDLNGHTLRRDLSEDESDGEVIYLKSDVILWIRDSSEGQTGKITGGYSSNGAGGIHAKSGSKIYFYGGSITGNRTTKRGGGIYLDDDAKLYLYGGKITYNVGEESHGGGIYADTDSEVFMTSGEISNNTVTGDYYGGGVYEYKAKCDFSGGEIKSNTAEYGGGVYLDSGGYYHIDNEATILIRDNVQIRDNSATIDGGGIFLAFNSILNCKGGNITENYAKRGGGVFVSTNPCGAQPAYAYLGGSAKIIGNRASTEYKNLCTEYWLQWISDCPFTSEAKIGVSYTDTKDKNFTHHYSNWPDNTAQYFISDRSNYQIGYTEEQYKNLCFVEGRRTLPVLGAVDSYGNGIATSRVDNEIHSVLIQDISANDMTNYAAYVKLGAGVTIKETDTGSFEKVDSLSTSEYNTYKITGNFSDNTQVILTLTDGTQEQNWDLLCSNDTENPLVGNVKFIINGAESNCVELDDSRWNTVKYYGPMAIR